MLGGSLSDAGDDEIGRQGQVKVEVSFVSSVCICKFCVASSEGICNLLHHDSCKVFFACAWIEVFFVEN